MKIREERRHHMPISQSQSKVVKIAIVAVLTIFMISGCGAAQKTTKQLPEEMATYNVPETQSVKFDDGEMMTISIALDLDWENGDSEISADDLSSNKYDHIIVNTAIQELIDAHTEAQSDEISVAEKKTKETLNQLMGDGFVKEVHIDEVK